MRPADLLCLACDFRVAINEQSDMTTVCKFQFLIFFCLLSLPISCLDVQLCFVGAQRAEMLIFVLLILMLFILIGFWCALRWYFYASVGEKIQKEMSLLSTLTCVHHPMSLSRTSGIRKVTNLCLLSCDLAFVDCFHRNST